MEFSIAIPTYGRYKQIFRQTLFMLGNVDINYNYLHIFVKDEDEKKKYLEAQKDSIFSTTKLNYVITGCNGIMEVRNHLKYYYRENYPKCMNILYLDDDIKSFYKLGVCQTLEKVSSLQFIDIINYFFKITNEKNYSLWGISSVMNSYFLRDMVTSNLKYIAGGFCGEIIRPEKDLILCDIDHGEDFQFSCEYFLRDGGILKFCAYCFSTNFFGSGGIQKQYKDVNERMIQGNKNIEYLADRYKGMVKVKNKKWGKDLSFNYFYKIKE